MSTLEARQIVKAREELKRAQREYQAAMLRDTHYRGVSTVITQAEPQEVHGTFTYRGNTYTK